MSKTKEIEDGTLIQVLKYAGTTCLILSWVITSLGYFPVNLIIEITGCALWTYVAWRWRDWPLFGVNGVIGILALISMFQY